MYADGKMQRVGAGTTYGIGIVVGVNAAGTIGSTVPGIVLTRILIVAVVSTIVQSEVQCGRAVATGRVEC